MARSTSLSDAAFAALRREKKENESDSDVVLRVLREAHRRRRDPDRFLRTPVEFAFSDTEWAHASRQMREADRRDPWGGTDAGL